MSLSSPEHGELADVKHGLASLESPEHRRRIAGEDSVDVWGWDSESPCLSDQAVETIAAAAVFRAWQSYMRNTRQYICIKLRGSVVF
jgi:hypothetical protein